MLSERAGSAGPTQLLSSLRWIRVAPILIIRDEDYADLSASLLLANEEPRPARWDCGRRGEDFSAFNAWQARGPRFPFPLPVLPSARGRVRGAAASIKARVDEPGAKGAVCTAEWLTAG